MARWFQQAFGFPEPKNFGAAQRSFTVSEQPSDGSVPAAAGPVHVLSTGTEEGGSTTFHVGPFEDPQVSELRARVRAVAESNDAPQGLGGLSFENVAGESRSMHLDPSNAQAVFQVASQFNCLEMVGPDVRPEDGVTRYVFDRTQGPACALACPAGTVWRNYFWAGRGQAGGDDQQLDTTRDAAALLDNQKHNYWQMNNGYLLPTRKDGLAELAQRLTTEPGLRDEVRSVLRAGVHWDTATVAEPPHRVAQVFCSAVPVAYARGASDADWEVQHAAHPNTAAPPAWHPPGHPRERERRASCDAPAHTFTLAPTPPTHTTPPLPVLLSRSHSRAWRSRRRTRRRCWWAPCLRTTVSGASQST